MHRFLGYALFFVALVLLQVFLFDNLGLGIYVRPLVYVALVVMLPMETPAVAVLLTGLAAGVCMDLVTATAGVNTIATLAVAYFRPMILGLVAGRENVREGGIPSPARIGRGKFLRYSTIIVLLHCFVFFSFESLGWSYFHLTLIRIVLSAAVTVPLVWFAQMLLTGGKTKQ